MNTGTNTGAVRDMARTVPLCDTRSSKSAGALQAKCPNALIREANVRGATFLHLGATPFLWVTHLTASSWVLKYRVFNAHQDDRALL